MKILSLNCNECGAPLDVPQKAKYVTCGFCDSRLAIQHSGNTYSTEVIEQLVQTTSAIQSDVEELKRRAAISDLDLDWERRKRSYVIKDKNGRESLPSMPGIFAQGIVSTGISVFVFVLFPPVGLFFMLLLGWNFARTFTKHSKYQAAQQRYRSQRRRLMFTSSSSNGSRRRYR